jgi:hypothetical protein
VTFVLIEIHGQTRLTRSQDATKAKKRVQGTKASEGLREEVLKVR